jgi:uncharacterized protein (DUF433 family)
MTSEELEAEIGRLSIGEKARIVHMLALQVAHAWPGIEKTPGVAGGDACVVRTRIPVWTLVSYRRLGWSEAKVLENFPSLRAADLVNAWAYGDAHAAEIDRSIRENEEA